MRMIDASRVQVGQRVENGGVVTAIRTESDSGYTVLSYGQHDRGRYAPGVRVTVLR